MTRSLILFLLLVALCVGCGDEKPTTNSVPPIGDKFDKGKDLKGKKDKKSNPTIGRTCGPLLANC